MLLMFIQKFFILFFLPFFHHGRNVGYQFSLVCECLFFTYFFILSRCCFFIVVVAWFLFLLGISSVSFSIPSLVLSFVSSLSTSILISLDVPHTRGEEGLCFCYHYLSVFCIFCPPVTVLFSSYLFSH
uniref:Uncharacterized protein n=1 Tax=Cacopsylla melanoneura TaxID=428564 RepID=A0A8D8ZF63_9HEMI